MSFMTKKSLTNFEIILEHQTMAYVLDLYLIVYFHLKHQLYKVHKLVIFIQNVLLSLELIKEVILIQLYFLIIFIHFQMEIYAMHLSLWRAAIFCGTLWLPLHPPSPIFVCLCTRFGLAGLFFFKLATIGALFSQMNRTYNSI